MGMQMGFRWYGEGNDDIKLSDIKQIPGVTSIVWALHDKMPGEVWEVEEIAKVQKALEPYGFMTTSKSDCPVGTGISPTISRPSAICPSSGSR